MSTEKREHGLRDLDRRLGRMTFAGFLKAWRESEALSQAEFARRIGLSPANLCDIEKGRKGVSPKKAAEIAEALGYSPNVLVQLAVNDELAAAGLNMTARIHVA